MPPAVARCMAALLLRLSQVLDACALAHVEVDVEGAIPVGERSGGEHACEVPGDVMRRRTGGGATR